MRAGQKSKGEKQGSVNYSTDQDKVRKTFIISFDYTACLTVSGTISVHAKRFQIFDARQKQIESSLTRC